MKVAWNVFGVTIHRLKKIKKIRIPHDLVSSIYFIAYDNRQVHRVRVGVFYVGSDLFFLHWVRHCQAQCCTGDFRIYRRLRTCYRLNGIRSISQIPQCTYSISNNAAFRTKMCKFLLWMVHCGIWNRLIVVYVNWVNYASLAAAAVKLRATLSKTCTSRTPIH